MAPPPSRQPGRHFLQIPGPSLVPERILLATARQVIDHRGPDFADIAAKAFEAIKSVFQTKGQVFIYPSSGTGAWEAAIVNTLSPGDRIIMGETGHFSMLWQKIAQRHGLVVDYLPGDWRSGADAEKIEKALREDTAHEIKAVCVVHNETSTGAITNIPAVRQALDEAGHPALLMVDTISGLGSVDFRVDEWGVDVGVAGSQKGLMMPAGLAFTAVSEKAMEAHKSAGLARSYFDWSEMAAINAKNYFPYTPATNLLYGLIEAAAMLHEEGLANVFARHQRHAAATRTAVRAWGLDVMCNQPGHESPALTTVVMPEGHSADAFRATVLEHYNMSLGSGLSKLADRVFRIGHLGDFNDLMLMGTLSGVEMGLAKAGVPHQSGGAQAAMEVLLGNEAVALAAE